MADRKQTPDIMSEMLTGAPAKKTESQHTSKTAKRQDGKAAKKKAGKPSAKKEKKPAPPLEEEKIKATFYLSPGGIDALESTWMKLRSQAGSERGRVSKSALVEVALERLQKDMKKEAEDILQAIL